MRGRAAEHSRGTQLLIQHCKSRDASPTPSPTGQCPPIGGGGFTLCMLAVSVILTAQPMGGGRCD